MVEYQEDLEHIDRSKGLMLRGWASQWTEVFKSFEQQRKVLDDEINKYISYKAEEIKDRYKYTLIFRRVIICRHCLNVIFEYMDRAYLSKMLFGVNHYFEACMQLTPKNSQIDGAPIFKYAFNVPPSMHSKFIAMDKRVQSTSIKEQTVTTSSSVEGYKMTNIVCFNCQKKYQKDKAQQPPKPLGQVLKLNLKTNEYRSDDSKPQSLVNQYRVLTSGVSQKDSFYITPTTYKDAEKSMSVKKLKTDFLKKKTTQISSQIFSKLDEIKILDNV